MDHNISQKVRDNVLVGWLFLRGLALIYFAAFASMAVQIEGLIGVNGILPIQAKLTALAQYFPQIKYYDFPTLFWLDASDAALRGACFIGLFCSVLLLFSVFIRAALILCYLLYLSITVAGQEFTAFQWDALLLEAGFMGLILTWGSVFSIYGFRWLIARFMLMAGIVKLASGDPAWWNLTALDFHFQTQPLPSPLAYYAFFLPAWFHQACVAVVFAIELIIPFFALLTRPFRLIAAWSFILLQCSIMLTGSFNFFNLLTVLLCLFLFDDRDIENMMPGKLVSSIRQKRPHPGRVAEGIAVGWLCLVVLVNAGYIWLYQTRQPIMQPFSTVLALTSTFSLVNNYGPFSIMTTERKEIIVQGSSDGINWRTYRFNYKPGDLDKPLTWNIPHQPRLDWQMWFAALRQPAMDSWFVKFMLKLQAGSPQVLSLLADNPFPERPPLYLRAVLFRYYFAPPQQRAETGRIWQRHYLGQYWPPV